mmetsp:Transcript_6377/g.11982  ORF Transcript_6377/g.11982 Transcript_6377/m.11982 type:complete len:292 (+) Transcript_6377:465-1340(+)
MLEGFGEFDQGLRKGHVQVHVKVVSLPCEGRVRQGSDPKIHMTGGLADELVALVFQHYDLSIRHPWLYLKRQNLLRAFCQTLGTRSASTFEPVSFPPTSWVLGLHLLHKPWTKLPSDHLHARAYARPVIRSAILIVQAQRLLLVHNANHTSKIEILEGDMDIKVEIRAALLFLLLPLSEHTPSKEHVEGIHTASSPGLLLFQVFLQTLFSVAIVHFSLLFVGESFVSIRDLLELLLRLFISWVFVRMVFSGKFPVCSLDFTLCSPTPHPKNFVEISATLHHYGQGHDQNSK